MGFVEGICVAVVGSSFYIDVVACAVGLKTLADVRY